MERNKKIIELKENAKMFAEALFIFKKEQVKLKNDNKINELEKLSLEILPIFEQELNNCFQLRNLEKQERGHYK